MGTKPEIHADPSIRNCAQALLMEAMEHINRRVANGESFWMARTATLASFADEWMSLYGKEAADQAVRGLHMLAPGEVLDRETQQAQRTRNAALTRAELAAHDPGRNTWLNRLWLSAFGVRLYLLAFAALAALPIAQPVEASTGRANWRALALCGVLKMSTERERICHGLSAASRGTWRGYDAPRGAPRTWELPRTWEVEP